MNNQTSLGKTSTYNVNIFLNNSNSCFQNKNLTLPYINKNQWDFEEFHTFNLSVWDHSNQKAKPFSRKFLFKFFEEEYSGLCAGNKISNLVAKETNCHMPKVFKVIYAKVHFILKNKNYNIWLHGANKVRDKSIQNRLHKFAYSALTMKCFKRNFVVFFILGCFLRDGITLSNDTLSKRFLKPY